MKNIIYMSLILFFVMSGYADVIRIIFYSDGHVTRNLNYSRSNNLIYQNFKPAYKLENNGRLRCKCGESFHSHRSWHRCNESRVLSNTEWQQYINACIFKFKHDYPGLELHGGTKIWCKRCGNRYDPSDRHYGSCQCY